MLIWILNIFAAYFLDFCARPELRLFSLPQEGSDRGQARPQLSLGPLTTGRNKIKYTTKMLFVEPKNPYKILFWNCSIVMFRQFKTSTLSILCNFDLRCEFYAPENHKIKFNFFDTCFHALWPKYRLVAVLFLYLA